MRILARLTCLPTWVITNASTMVLPKGHPWRGKWFTLADWHEHRSDFCRFFDMTLWIKLVSLIIILLMVYK